MESGEWSFPLTAAAVTFLRKDRENVKERRGSRRDLNSFIHAKRKQVTETQLSARMMGVQINSETMH